MGTCRKYLIFLLITLSSFLLHNCTSSKSTQDDEKWNLSAIYNPLSTKLHPVYSVFHNTDESSLVFIKLFISELKFQAIAAGEEVAQVQINAVLYDVSDSKSVVADSIDYTLNIKKNTKSKYYTQIPIKTQDGKYYQLKIVARDLIRKTFNLQFVDIDKKNLFSPQNFNVLDNSGMPHFSNVFKPSSSYRIRTRDPLADTLYISYFAKQAPIPDAGFPSPSDELVYKKADSLWVLEYNPNLLLQFTYSGLYFFQFDTTLSDGFTALCFGDEYPKINSVNDMLGPLAFIANEAEFKKIQNSDNLKLSLDNFWLNIGGSPSRAREMIRIFYNRVYFANYFFTDSKEGWKTDRGMVYSVYGPPQGLKKSGNSETWSYFPGQGAPAINFTFLLKPTKFSYKNYTLDRSNSQDWHWKEIVDAWRSGDIYLMD